MAMKRGLFARLYPFGKAIGRRLPTGAKTTLRSLWNRLVMRRPDLGTVDLADLRRLKPISAEVGWDRGQPIDRYYIDRFLDTHRHDIRGHVLEAGEDRYTRAFGDDRVTRCDILDVVDGLPNTTIVADLTAADEIPDDAFDCIILTQTLQMIYDTRAALRHAHRILRPRGSLIMTTHGISPICRVEGVDPWGEYWHFTSQSLRRLCAESMPGSTCTITAYGNVLSAAAWLYGLAAEELSQQELDHRDPRYEILIGVRAVKAAS